MGYLERFRTSLDRDIKRKTKKENNEGKILELEKLNFPKKSK